MFRIRRHWTNPSDSNLTGQTSPITNSSKRTERLPTSLTNICEDARSGENPPPSVDPAVPRYREDLRAMFSRKKCPQNPELAAFVRKSTPSSVDSGVLRVTFRWAAADTPTWLISAARNSGPEMRFRSTKWSDELAVLGNDWKQRYYSYARACGRLAGISKQRARGFHGVLDKDVYLRKRSGFSEEFERTGEEWLNPLAYRHEGRANETSRPSLVSGLAIFQPVFNASISLIGVASAIVTRTSSPSRSGIRSSRSRLPPRTRARTVCFFTALFLR